MRLNLRNRLKTIVRPDGRTPIARKVITYVAIFAASTVGIALIFNLVMSVLIGGRQTEVPDIRGLAEQDAIKSLDAKGLRYENAGTDYTSDYAESMVFLQEPQAGRIVKQGRKVLVTLSRGPEFREVPYCAGKSMRAAQILIERAGFTVGNVSWVTLPRGYHEEVLSTEPRPGSKVIRGTTVNILASKAYPLTRAVLADLVGHAYLRVKIELEGIGVIVRESTSDREIDPFKSRVVAQEPQPGFIVSRGDTVSLVVSTKYKGKVKL